MQQHTVYIVELSNSSLFIGSYFDYTYDAVLLFLDQALQNPCLLNAACLKQHHLQMRKNVKVQCP